MLSPERFQDFKRGAWIQGQIVLPTDAPAPPTLTLQQKHIVGVNVRPDAPARRRVAEHHIVKTRIGHEGEAPQQSVRRRQQQVQALNQQRPALIWQGGKIRAIKGAVIEKPLALLPAHHS